MFSRDEMQRAIEDALKTMEGVALELYRRGREEAREELETVKRERDEARAEAEQLRETKDYLRTWLSSEELEGLRVKAAEHPLLWEEIHHLKAEVERLRMMLPVHPSSLTDACTDAYGRGAEAMREACAVALMSDGLVLSRERAANAVRALPIPEEP